MIQKRDKHHERGAEKCVSEHWVTLWLNLSTSKVSPQGWGLDGWGQGVVRGKVSEGTVREKGERLHTRVQSGVRRFGPEGTRKSVTPVKKHRVSNVFCVTEGKKHMEHQTGLISQEHLKAKVITHALNAGLRLSWRIVAQNTRRRHNWLNLWLYRKNKWDLTGLGFY